MTYGHVGTTYGGGNTHITLNQATHKHHVNNTHGDQGDTVESIMVMGFIGNNFDYIIEAHADCMNENQHDMQVKDKEGLGSGRYRHQEVNNGAHISRRTNWQSVSTNEKLSSRVGSVWVKHHFNETTYVAQPLIVVQGPYIRWSMIRSACVGIHKHSGEIEGSLIPHIGTLQHNVDHNNNKHEPYKQDLRN
eukprot:12883123-Heterocapsa_arctica.AAC.1